MLEATNLECVRGGRRLFAGLSFSLEPHTLFEIRGANGSGKTTLLRTLSGLHAPVAGGISWRHADIAVLGEQYRDQVLYLGHLNAVNNDLTAVENLQFTSRLAGLDAGAQEATVALEWVGLTRHLRQPCGTLSQGQRRRVALARLRLASAKPLWLLDEPFAALDSTALALAQALLAAHLDAGGMVALSTHQDLSMTVHLRQQIDLGS